MAAWAGRCAVRAVDLAETVKECITGTLSYNGQRCTALKLLFVHDAVVDKFVALFAAAVDAMKLALPWEDGVKLTPVPEPNKPQYLKELVDDAVAKGAKVVNGLGGQQNGSLVRPTVVYPCTKDMRVWKEEQFGPLIPIAPFSTFDDCYAYLSESPFGQQAAVFTKDVQKCAPLLDVLAYSVGRVNINSQCQRGPDTFPFAGRKSSALGTLSVSEALKTVSMPSPRSTCRLTSSPVGSVMFSPVEEVIVRDSLPLRTEDIIKRTVEVPVRP